MTNMSPRSSIGDWPATAIDYLDKHAGAFTALLTLALVAVTIYYAVQNRRMVGEMKAARNAAILPKLALEFHRLGPAAMTVAIRNVGPGAALNVDTRVVFEPITEGDSGAAREEFRWRRNILAPGEQYDFLPPGDLNDNLNSLPQRYRELTLVGSMKDAAGTTHKVDEALDDLPEWRRVLEGARQRWAAADPERRTADELYKRFEQPLRELNQGIQGVASAVHRLVPPEPPDDTQD
jgi:hypothetical protein